MGFHFPLVSHSHEKKILGGIFLLAILHGILYISIIPPWQHYDEPGHFEYVWLLANRNGFPKAGDYDQGMRREVAASMVEYGFFKQSGFYPNLVSQSEPIWIGISQTGDVPLYYWLVSLPLRLVRTSDITFQLYLGRVVSLILYVLSVFAAYEFIVEITKSGSVYRWLVPISLICMPGFTDLMTAVNNDVGAVTFFSFFLWASARLMIKGKSFWRLLVFVLVSLLCVITKITIWAVIVLFPVPIVFSLANIIWRRQIMAVIAVVYMILLIIIITPSGAVSWYTENYYQTGKRVITPHASTGKAAISLTLDDGVSAKMYQPLNYNQVQALRGHVVTLGAWIWADQPLHARPLVVQDSNQQKTTEIELDTYPQFVAITSTIAIDAQYINVILQSTTGQDISNVNLYFDDVILVEGNFKQADIPQLSNSGNISLVNWSGQQVINLVRNSSFEKSWLGIRSVKLHSSIDSYFNRISQSITSLSDLSSSRWYYIESLRNLFRTFWGKFGWGNIHIKGLYTYYLLFLVTFAGVIGAGHFLWNRRKSLNWSVLIYLFIAMVLVWSAALIRGIESLSGDVFISSSRYAFPVMTPTLLLLSVGWFNILSRLTTKFKLPSKLIYVIYWSFFVGLDVLSWWSILDHYRLLA